MKAVIPVAGFGTRMLPASKSIPKELITLVDKPLIQYVINEIFFSGITEVVLVTHASKSVIENHFDTNFELEWQLEEKGKVDLLQLVRSTLPRGMKLSVVRQSKGLGLGHAILCAKEACNSDDIAVLLPDVLVNEYESNLETENLSAMIKNFRRSGNSQVLVEEIPMSEVGKYGVADLNGASISKGESIRVSGFVEKPLQSEAPSNLAVVGRYVLSKNIWKYLETTAPGSGGEIQLTDAIDALIMCENVDAFCMTGKSNDCGNLEGYIETFIEYALRNRDYNERAMAIVKSLSRDV